jgi:hypothetical protein
MATHLRGSVVSLLASSYAESIKSAANLILTKGNTLLAEEEIKMCTVLRMNRSFMEFMRKYCDETELEQPLRAPQSRVEHLTS